MLSGLVSRLGKVKGSPLDPAARRWVSSDSDNLRSSSVPRLMRAATLSTELSSEMGIN